MKPGQRGKKYWLVYWSCFTLALISIVVIMWHARPMEVL